MTALHTYLPQDRRRALAQGQTLPDRTHGTVLFADISGFTALTEQLTHTLGPRRGMEELTHQISTVYAALIAVVEKYGGSVIDFAGDAMLCWFEGEQARLETGPAHGAGDWRLDFDHQSLGASRQALACAFAMQTAMHTFPQLALKVALATGPVRRWVVGNPAHLLLDVLAGATVIRAAEGEHLAHQGEVLLDEATAHASAAPVTAWRTAETGERFGVMEKLFVSSYSLLEITSPNNQSLITNNLIFRPFILPAVYERETSGQGAFLTEFRPCAVMFVRFTGIDYDNDKAQAQLDAIVQHLQATAAHYEGNLLQITIGDKGSYAYLNFGALSVHEDDAQRALKTALALRRTATLPIQMGITQGVVRVGKYGGPTRCTYGALGDEVNLAARLMMTAQPGEILVSGHVHKAAGARFSFEPRPPLPLKGKAEPLSVFAATGEPPQRALRLQEPSYALPMVGRARELQVIQEKLALAAQGQAQVIGIMAEAGMGKSRLVAEAIRAAHQQHFVGYGGACQADGVHTPYLVWKSIWSAFFDLNPAAPLKKQLRALEGELEDRAPTRVQAVPLLSPLLDLTIPDNTFTQTLEPQLRQSALHALLEDCLKAAAQEAPILLVLEDMHWVDAVSFDLLEQLVKAAVNCPACFVLAYRPPQAGHLLTLRLAGLPQFTQIALRELNHAEAAQAIRAKLAQLYPAHSGGVSAELVDKLMARAQGNPFFLEELLNYLRDRGLDPHDPAALEKIALPNSLHTLILSRIDQLTEYEKTTLRVASIIGRLFRAAWLTGYYPALGAAPQVQTVLEELSALDITSLDTPEPELSYLFKHIVTHEVTYESLPFATRAALHEQLARYLEQQIERGVLAEAPLLETLAFHYEHSANADKQRAYFRKAGAAAQQSYANADALEFYTKLLPLLTQAEKVEVYLQRGMVLELIGEWAQAETDYRAALTLAEAAPAQKAQAQFALGKLCRLRGDYEAAFAWLAQAQAGRTALGDQLGLARVLIEMGTALWHKGELAAARELLQAGLRLAQTADDKLSIALALNNLGVVAGYQNDLTVERAAYEESLALRRELGDKAGIATSLNDLGHIALNHHDYPTAQALLAESLALRHEIGDKPGLADSLNALGNVASVQGDYITARRWYTESLALCHELGDKSGIADLLFFLGRTALVQGDHAAGQTLFEKSIALSRESGNKVNVAMSLLLLGRLVCIQGDAAAARALCEESLALCQAMGYNYLTIYAFLSLGLIGLTEEHPTAQRYILQSLHLSQETKQPSQQASCLIGAAGLALQAGDAQRAAQLLGAVAAVLKAIQTVPEAIVYHFHAQTLAATKAALGETTFQAAWAAGEKMTLVEAMALGLAGVP